MNKLSEKIEMIFSMDENNAIKINDNAYIYKDNKSYMCVIPYEYEQEIDESFVGIDFFTDGFNYENRNFKALYLKTKNDIDVGKFSYLAAKFADEKNREEIISNPIKWINDWKDMFGNAIKDKKVYDVIGELISLKYAYENDKTIKWYGPLDGTHDLVGENHLIEVKSTIRKVENIISINSAFQLKVDSNVNEKIYFCRLEKKDYCISINSIVKELIELGYNEEDIENNLKIMGYKKGNFARDESYDLLELKSYDVNEQNFPNLSLAKINQDNPFNSIVGFELKIDLTSIPFEKIF